MSWSARGKRWTYLTHRWLGIGGCVLMLLWFLSGMVMLFIGYPKLTPQERLAATAPLAASGLRGLDVLPPALQARPESVALRLLRGQPVYLVRAGKDAGAWSARDGRPLPAVDTATAAQSAAAFAGADAHAVAPVGEDRWTHSGALDPHRPLYRVEVGGPAPASLYVSSRTGEVVLDAPYAQQRWNYVGAWLHWVYMIRMQPRDPVWTWTVIVLSALCSIAAFSGVLVGVWRWRFQGRYRSGAKTPYTEPWMRWHHLLGLMASALVCTWIFSGLMSMNPAGLFSSERSGGAMDAYRGPPPSLDSAVAQPAHVLDALADAGFAPVELQWRRMGGALYALAFDRTGEVRVVNARLQIARQLPRVQVEQAARSLVAAPVLTATVIERTDAYYYARAAEAMNGAASRRLPALKLTYADPAATTAYIELATGDVVLVMGQRERVGRWLFNFLHSWDLPVMLGAAGTRQAILLLLSLGGTALCSTALVIAWRRLRRKFGAAPQRRHG
ncbi:PepSY domain-containing protein [Stenotrophomonas sp. 24(2023)]|uniref:PepSY domain-containing protein n=1 Tax=Stenotrophomonas sp. 24(2023) TaxID=3068324 RepID=UPI0027E0465C|nr:PepSY domain-containing protein [Stenotrophomonas sp. 24(2023)]WMJ69364.1 PepSY domain-containing protein [Stenotrophomonas sp. 24(2023)]